jgi:hypothetical protein
MFVSKRCPRPVAAWRSSSEYLADARLTAAAIVDATCTADDPVGSLGIRAGSMRVGLLEPAVRHPESLARALDAAPTMLDM